MKKHSNVFTILGAILVVIPHYIANIIGLVLLIIALINNNATKKCKKTARYILLVAVVLSLIVLALNLLPGANEVIFLGVPALVAGGTQAVIVLISYILLGLKISK